MAGQQVLFAETITAMKKALSRYDDASESDESNKKPTNRGNKLKRKAKYVQSGHLDQADGPRVYKRRIQYNGYWRHIISRNRPRLDADGDVIDDEDEAIDSTAVDDDPYAEVRIENILMPLTSATDLPNHPSLSVPYKSKVLEEMVHSARDMVQREQESLWRMKQLLVEFRGDESWTPCSSFLTENDPFVFGQIGLGTSGPPSTGPDVHAFQTSPANWDTMSNVRLMTDLEDAAETESVHANGAEPLEQELNDMPHDAYEAPDIKDTVLRPDNSDIGASFPDAAMDADHARILNLAAQSNFANEHAPRDDGLDGESELLRDSGAARTKRFSNEGEELANGTISEFQSSIADEAILQQQTNEPNGEDNVVSDKDESTNGQRDEDELDGSAEPTAHRMTTRTRARAQAVASDPASVPALSRPINHIAFVHPFFLVPLTSLPDRDCVLPPKAAAEIRRQLSAYVQKQEEVCRGAEELYTGLMKGLRLRKTVLGWCIAEAHVGEWSDGEDWCDVGEWGLEEEELRKGEEGEDEEGGNAVVGKKTRRRGPG